MRARDSAQGRPLTLRPSRRRFRSSDRNTSQQLILDPIAPVINRDWWPPPGGWSRAYRIFEMTRILTPATGPYAGGVSLNQYPVSLEVRLGGEGPTVW